MARPSSVANRNRAGPDTPPFETTKPLPPLKTVPVGDSTKPTGVAISHDGLTAYFANGRANRVSIFSIAAMMVTDTIPVGQRPWGVALTSDGNVLYTADGRSNQLSVVDVIHKRVVRTIKVGERPYGVAIVGG